MDIGDKQRKTASLLRNIYDYTMGVLWLGVGIFVLFQKKFGYDLKLGVALTYIFGISCSMYGLFRIYRGFKNK